jgi:MBG domain (YGX type)
LVGYNDGTSTITKSYSSSTVSVTGPNAEGGGLVGYNNGTISDAYARGSVTGSNGSILGGFVGYNDSTGSITRTYAANVVTAATGPLPNSSGGFVGTNISGASITKSFWDTSLTSGGFGTNTGTFSAVGLATSLMQDSLSSNGFYALASAPAQGWDFHTVWSVPNFDPAQSSDGQRHYAELYALSRVVSAIADDATKTYGDPNPALSATTYGLQNSDVLATPVTVLATTITPASNVGTYAGAISVSGGSAVDQASNNYRFVYLPGTFTITPRPITITGGTVDRFYGAPNPPTTDQFTTALTTGSGSGLVNGDKIGSVTVTSATNATTGVGNYAFTPGAANFAAGSATNYTITYADGALTVHPAALTIIADAQTRAFNAANPPLTYHVSGTLFNGDMITGAMATTANTGSPAGNYPITQGTLTASSNYNLAYVGALLTVLPGGLPGGTPGGTPSASPSIIDASLLASSIVRDSFYPIALPDDASPIFNAPTIVTTLGTGIFYVDPRFDQIFVCFGGGGGTARACFAAKE